MSHKVYGYTFVTYPESMDFGFIEKLLTVLPICYCMHDKDVDNNGNLKKTHIHWFLQGHFTSRQLDKYRNELGLPSYIEPVYSARGLMDYLTHENNVDKYHYDKNCIVYSSSWSDDLENYDYVGISFASILNMFYDGKFSDINGLINLYRNDEQSLKFIFSHFNSLNKFFERENQWSSEFGSARFEIEKNFLKNT